LSTARVYVHKERRITIHQDHIGIALKARKPRRIAKRESHHGSVTDSRIIRCPLTDKDLRSLAVVVVVQMRLPQSRWNVDVEMIVKQVGLPAVDEIRVLRSHRRNDLDVGILRLDCVVEHREPRVIACSPHVEPVFVSNFNESQLERLRMSVFRTASTPDSTGATCNVFDLVQRLSRLGLDVPAVAELDLNPVLGLPDRCIAVDARVRIQRPAAHTPTKSW
jgi:hypothetical protein